MSKKIRERICGTFEILLYIGSREGYNGEPFTEDRLMEEIRIFQDTYPGSMPVRLSQCVYLAGTGYAEKGHEISAIMYPNQYRTEAQMQEFMTALAKHLLITFKQNRITLRRIAPTVAVDQRMQVTTMFEIEHAEVSTSIN